MKKLFIAPALVAMALPASAVNFYWTGAVNTDYVTAGNWVTGSVNGPVASVPPADADYTDHIFFTDHAGLVNKTPVLTTSTRRRINTVNFVNTVGWVSDFSTAGLMMRQIICSGQGTNKVLGLAIQYKGNFTWTVGAGNTLHLSGGMSADGVCIITMAGGGTIISAGSRNQQTATATVLLRDFLLRLENAALFDNSARPYIYQFGDKTSRFQYKNTVAHAKARFGNTFVNTFGHGHTLHAEDIGGGYVEVSLRPPPTLFMLQ